MKITREFFKGDLFLPAMKPSITDNSDINSIQSFIDEYSGKCLIECFGYTLFEELQSNSDDDKAKTGADIKWKNLIDGEIIDMPDGSKKRWKGIFYKSNLTVDKPDFSFITNYVYFFYERSEYIAKSTTGDVKLKASGGILANAGYKTSIVWNKFVDMVVGNNNLNKGIVSKSDFGTYINWFNSSNEFSLYEFINYKNSLVKDTYKHFTPKYFSKINEFGI